MKRCFQEFLNLVGASTNLIKSEFLQPSKCKSRIAGSSKAIVWKAHWGSAVRDDPHFVCTACCFSAQEALSRSILCSFGTFDGTKRSTSPWCGRDTV